MKGVEVATSFCTQAIDAAEELESKYVGCTIYPFILVVGLV